jgi:N-acetylglucosaminyldiphosphoundecaprenol N-acetyl-beta-D-mannosaminyltransferase
MHSTARIFDVPVSATSMEDVLHTIDGWIAKRERQYICTLDVHALMESQKDGEIRRIYNGAAMVTPDGMPLVWLLHHNGHPLADRICGPDLMTTVFRHSEDCGYRHFLYGSSPRTLDKLTENIQRQYSRARIVGSFSPPFREPTDSENAEITRRINAAEPDIVWVGLGAPKQDRWMARHRRNLTAPVLVGVGGAFDMISGVVERAPSFLRRTGCEWMFRVYKEPRRLAKRYLKSNSQFTLMLLIEKFHLQKHQYRY